MKLFKKCRTLIAGPWLNELGWELMLWQAAVRYQRISKKYEHVYVITFKNRECLYEDCKIFAHDEQLIKSSFGISRVPEKKGKVLTQACVDHFAIKGTFDLFSPNTYCSLPYRIRRKIRKDLMHRKFYFPPVDNRRFDIAFHFRSFEREDDSGVKSFPIEKAAHLVELCKGLGLDVCCIGAPGYSYVAEGAENRQANDLSRTIATICASKLVVGGSSAPMHLASLCEVPIVVWIGPPADIERYLSYWNPFHSKVFVVTDEKFDPDVSMVTGKIEEIFDQGLLPGLSAQAF